MARWLDDADDRAAMPVTAIAVERTLVAVAGMMTGARDPWWIIGSAAVALHGGEPAPIGDVDVLASERDAVALLRDRGMRAGPGRPDERFRSAIFARLDGAPLPIELMAGFEVAVAGGWRRTSFATRQPVEVAGATLFVPSAADLVALLATMGRDKDLAHAALIG